MSKKIILITGSSSGFGRLAAESLARRSHIVYASMRGVDGKNAAKAEELRRIAKDENLALYPLELDVTDDRSVREALAAVVAREGRIDVVINNAGIASFGLTEAYEVDEIKQIFETNVYGPARVNRAALPYMREQGSGRLVHISSVLGRLVVPTTGVYAASKFALEALAESLRYELAPLGIDSTVIEPGAYPTEIFGKVGAPRDSQRTESYGEAGQVGDKIVAGLEAAVTGPDAPDPREISDTIVNAVEADTVPVRTAIGAEAPPANLLNRAAEEAQSMLFTAFGLDDLATSQRDDLARRDAA